MKDLNSKNTAIRVQLFNSNLGKLRVIIQNGEPLFLGADVAQALGEKKDKMYQRLNATYKILKNPRECKSAILDFPQNVTKIMFITEDGLYSLINHSTKPQAKEFKQWICEEVMPSIKGGRGQSVISFGSVEARENMQISTNAFKEALPILKNVIGDAEVNSVNARDLHKSLESGKDFSNWVKNRIEKLNLIEGADYIKISPNSTLAQSGERENKGFVAGSNKIDYIITLDIAKHFCMLEMTDKGHRVRQYFIECEKQLQKTQLPAPMTLKESLLLNLRLVEENERLQAKIEADKPRLEFVNHIEETKDTLSIGEFAKLLTKKGIKIGEKQLFNWLRENKYLNADNIPYQKYLSKGYIQVAEVPFVLKSGRSRIYLKSVITGKGQLYFTNKLKGTKNGK